MAEAHDLALAGEGFIQPGLGPAGVPDLLESMHDRLVRPAVQRAFERADRDGDRGVDIGQGRGDDAGGEGRRIEGVLRVEDERDAESVHHRVIRDLAEREPEEVARVIEVVARLDGLEAAAAALDVRDDGGQLREQGDGPAGVEFGVEDAVPLRQGGVDATDLADRGAQRIHRMSIGRDVVERPACPVVQAAEAALPLLELGQLAGVRQLSVPQQPGDLLERAVRRELLNGVAAVEKRVGLGVHRGDGRGVHHDTGEALVDLRVGHGCSFAAAGGARQRLTSKVKTEESNAL